MKKSAFTLLEILIWIAMAVVLAEVLYPWFSRQSPKRAEAGPKPAAARFIWEQHSRINQPSFTIFTDTKTGREYLSVYQGGIIELKSSAPEKP